MTTETTQSDGIPAHPFPPTRPAVTIVKSSERINAVDCPELQWWFAVPRLGERYVWATYDAETLRLAAVTELTSTTPATVQDISCVEIRVKEWTRNDWPAGPEWFYAVLDEEHTRWLSVAWMEAGKKVSYTLGDEGFEGQWGELTQRRIVDDGRYQLQPDGAYRLTDKQGLGAGTYDVTIGERTFTCLRVLDVDISEPHGGELAEVFIESGGRTVFFRRYDGQHLRGHDLVKKFPHNRRIVINDTTYVHADCTGWAHDTVPEMALRP